MYEESPLGTIGALGLLKSKKCDSYIVINADVITDVPLDDFITFHNDNKNKTNEMIIALMKRSYIPPHIHPDGKSESYHVIEGKMNVYIFSKKGIIPKKFPIKIKMKKVKINGVHVLYFSLPILGITISFLIG